MAAMATPMMIGEAERVSLRALRIVAAENPVDVVALMRRIHNPDEKAKHMAQMTEQSIHIPLAYLVTYSVEINHPIGTVRHMSISSQVPGRVPTPEAVWMVAEMLGFEGGLEQCSVYQEPLQRGEVKATSINVIQPINSGTLDDPSPHQMH